MAAFMKKMQIEFPCMPGREMVPFVKFQSLKQKQKVMEDLDAERENFKNKIQEEKYRA
jgi:hypothetical protein